MITTFKIKDHKGFTLTELLVVISIIGILSALAFPVASSIISSSEKAGCASNLRQIGVLLTSYATDNNDYLPLAWAEGQDSWWEKLTNEGYYTGSLGNTKGNIFISPGRQKTLENNFSGTTYSVHDYLFRGGDSSLYQGTAKENDLLYKFVNIKRPSELIIVANGAQVFEGGQVYSGFWDPWQMNPNWDAVSDSQMNLPIGTGSNTDDFSAGGYFRYPHDNNTSANVLMADGHVENFKVGEVLYRHVIANK